MKINPESKKGPFLEVLLHQMLVAARTAPKSAGLDDITTALVTEGDFTKIVSTMRHLAERGEIFSIFERDAVCLEQADGCILIGVDGSKPLGLNCGACGLLCDELNQRRVNKDFSGPGCVFKMLDLGIALGSCARTASDLCLDNRLMYTVGVAAKRAGLIEADVVIGIPVSISGKSPFFDRKHPGIAVPAAQLDGDNK